MRQTLTASLFAFSLAMPLPAMAVGGDDSPPPATPTTQSCPSGTIWDAAIGKCVKPDNAQLDDDTRMQAVRELAYADRIPEARVVLDSVQDQSADMVLTYRGFTARKLGQMAEAQLWYGRALAANPDNLLARSYMGQGYVEQGKIQLARAELSEIRARGGRGTWAEVSLRLALQSGRGYSY